MVTVCGAGEEPPRVLVKESELPLSTIDPAVTVRVTGIVIGLLATAPAPVAVMVTAPVYVPGDSRLGITEMVRTLPLAVVPASGPTNNQLPPLAVWKVAV